MGTKSMCPHVAYDERQLKTEKHKVGKHNTQNMERNYLNFRTRETICFSKIDVMHDTVIGLLINKVELGVDIHAKLQV
jgi:insertion element IS1 protein InsB